MDISGQVDADVGDLQDRLINVHQPVHQPCLSLCETKIVRQWKHGRERETGRREKRNVEGKKRKEEERRGRGNSHCMVSQTSFTKISLILFDFVRRRASTLQPTHFLRHTIRITDLHNNSSGQFEVPVKPGVPNSSTIGLHPHCNVAQLGA